MRDFSVAVGQWPVAPEREPNLERAERFLAEAARAGAALCVLPEMFQTPYELEAMRANAEPEDGPTLSRLRAAAARLGLHVVAGSFPERRGEEIFNSSFVLGPSGEILGVHRKIHLFDVALDEVRIEESRVLSPGRAPLALDLPFCRLGVAICYDVRFPAVFRHFEAKGVEVVAVPAAFSRTTGRAHWHPVLRSRAIESQVYLAAASPAPDERSSYVAYGHSLVVDPWGEVLAEAGEGEERILARLLAARLEEVRRGLPLLRHRRGDLYREWPMKP